MSNYTITTNFGAKDDLPSGNAAKVIKGSEFTTEFTNIKTAVNSKADSVSPTFTGDTALNGTTTFGPDGTSTFNGTVNFTKDVTFDTNTMFVDVSENRVGIGNVAPATALDVTGVITTDGLTSSTGIDVTGTVTASGLTVDTNTLHVDASNDRVGIGTTSPDTLLELVGADPILTIRDSETTGANTNATLRLAESGASDTLGNYWDINHTGNGELRFVQDRDGVNNERMRINYAGNLGIGTTNPVGSLDIKTTGNVGFEFFPENTTDTNLIINYDRTSDTYQNLQTRAATHQFLIGTSEKMRIDSSGNVGIGTDSPTSLLDIRGSVNGNLDLAVYNQFDDNDENAPNPSARLYLSAVSNNAYLEAHGAPEDSAGLHKVDLGSTAAGSFMTFSPNGSEKMRIDSSGNLLVGKPTNSVDVAGGLIRANGLISGCVEGNYAGIFNRKTSSGDDADGAIVQFRKDTTTVGSVGTNENNYLYVGNGDTNLAFSAPNDLIFPRGTEGAQRDGVIDLGNASNRFADIYATNGTIQTSDRNEKQDIAELSDAEQRVAVAAKSLLRKFRWRDAVEAKGDEARIHFGIIAQDLQDAFTAEGLDAGDYAMFINSTWTDEETGEKRSRMGVRYSELLAFIISAI